MRRCHEKLVLLKSDSIVYNKQERSDVKYIEQAGIVLLCASVCLSWQIQYIYALCLFRVCRTTSSDNVGKVVDR